LAGSRRQFLYGKVTSQTTIFMLQDKPQVLLGGLWQQIINVCYFKGSTQPTLQMVYKNTSFTLTIA
jgi:hypothetical protein